MRILLVIARLSEGYSMDAVSLALKKMSKDDFSPSPGTWFVVTEKPMQVIVRGLERLVGEAGEVLVLDVHDSPTTGYLEPATWRWFKYWRST